MLINKMTSGKLLPHAALFFAVIFVSGSYSQANLPDKEKLHIYLLIGQSNMAGRAPYTAEEAQVIPGCYLLNDADLWVPAKNPLNLYSTIRKAVSMQKMGPGYGFAQTMLQARSDVTLGLVVNARGGSSITEWERSDFYYTEAVRRAKAAQQTGTLKGMLWHQGESDEFDSHYLDKLTALVANLRQDLGDPELPFVAGEINNVPLINNQIDQLPQTVPFTGVASAAGLVAMDRWHFDNPSIKLLGMRYAEEMLRIQNTPPVANAGGPYLSPATGWNGAVVSLDGSGSNDSDGDTITYEWDLDLSFDSDLDGNPSNDVDETAAVADYVFPIGVTDISLVVRDAQGLSSEPDVTTVTVSVIGASVDIKPGADPNTVNLKSKGVIPVAFLSDESFDALTINPMTITLLAEDFDLNLVKMRGGKHGVPMATAADVDHDGDLDLLVQIDTSKLAGFNIDATCEFGALTYDGDLVYGADSLRVVPK